MSLRFLGDWNPWAGGAAALLLAALAWMLYRRETRKGGRRLAWVLPVLRALGVFMAVMMLTGPVLHHRRVVGERGRVLVFVDGSQSMRLTDEPLHPARKLLAVHRLGLLPADAVDTKLAEAADALARARRAAGGDTVDPAGLKDSAPAFQREIAAAGALLGKVRSDTGGVALERKGVILREFWTELPGTLVADLTKHKGFPNAPSGTAFPEILEAPVNWADNYGTRLRGFIHPPVTGKYVFWVSGDDQAELWLSPDADPARKALVARAPGWTNSRAWDTHPEQKSQEIRLSAGQKYYIEALQKDATGGDSLAAGWQLPGGALERPIPGSRLSAPSTPAESPANALESMIARFRGELQAPSKAFVPDRDAAKAAAGLTALVRAAARWEKELRQAFANYANRVSASPDARVLGALQKFDTLPRWKRAEAILLGGSKSLLERLAESHHVELLSLSGREAETLWTSSGEAAGPEDRVPKALPREPSAPTTDLAGGINARAAARQAERTAVVLLSDGQHNDGTSPLQMAKLRGTQRTPVYAIGLGGAELPEDIAVLSVKAPEQVFYKDRVRGEIALKDDMPAGRPFTVRIEAGGELLWERKLVTEQTHVRTVPFDFPLQALVEKLAAKKVQGVDVFNMPLSLQATVTGVDGEREKRNNDARFDLHAVMQKRKILVLDGRPRWETRYLRNLFERDEQWEVNVVLADRGTDAGSLPRGAGAGKFPGDRESLFAYDFLVFGEVPRQLLKMEELEWIRDFVGKRGAGMLVLDGRRGHVGNYAQTPIGPLFPVEWKGEPVSGRPGALRLTEAGSRQPMLQLASEPEKNREIWDSLRPPHGIVPSKALVSAETLVEALVGERRVPALVHHRYEAGRVLYAASDETWRWRYEVADLHHSRYWNQVLRFMMEPPFAVRSPRISLDAGRPVYAHGESAVIRARVRDAQGRPVAKPAAEAWLFKDGQKVGVVALVPDENTGGLLHGKTGPMAGGRYEVRLHAEGLGEEETRARTGFSVQPREKGELAALHCNEELLRQIAAHSGGAYFREEESLDLVERLEPLNKERVHESDTVLWQSWWWFAPLLALFAVEWVLRKWAGML